VDDSADLPSRVRRRAEAALRELLLEPCEDLVVREALALQRVVAAADERLGRFAEERQHLVDAPLGFGAREAAGPGEVIDQLAEIVEVRHGSQFGRLDSKKATVLPENRQKIGLKVMNRATSWSSWLAQRQSRRRSRSCRRRSPSCRPGSGSPAR